MIRDYPNPSHFLSVYGLSTWTAYFGFFDVGKPKAGENVVVSAAAGATGSMVCQFAKIHGCRVTAIAGSDDKLKWLKEELGVDAVINYKTTKNLKKEVLQHNPKGVDIYFDNVGGDILDTLLATMKDHGRVLACGAISSYTNTENSLKVPKGLQNYSAIISKRIRY